MMFCSIASQAMSLVKVYRFIRWREVAPLLIVEWQARQSRCHSWRTSPALVPHRFRRHSRELRALHADATFADPTAADACGRLTLPARSFLRSGSRRALSEASRPCRARSWSYGASCGGCRKENQRALVQPFIIAIQIFAIGLYCLQPQAIGFDLFRHLALALPAVALGTFIGMSMFSKVNDRIFRCSTLVIILASGCLMVFA